MVPREKGKVLLKVKEKVKKDVLQGTEGTASRSLSEAAQTSQERSQEVSVANSRKDRQKSGKQNHMGNGGSLDNFVEVSSYQIKDILEKANLYF